MIKTILKTLLLLAALGYLVFAIVKVSRPTEEMACSGMELQIVDSNAVNLVDKASIEKFLSQQKINPEGKTLAEIDIHGIDAQHNLRTGQTSCPARFRFFKRPLPHLVRCEKSSIQK